MFDIRSLVTFVYARKTGTLSGAARAMGTSATTASNAIARLENQLSMPLLIKTPKGNLPAVGSDSVLFFSMLLLEGLARIQNAFAEGNEPISLSLLETQTVQLMKLGDDLEERLTIWRDLRLSPLLIFRFIAVYEHGSINRAATVLGIAQPQISRQMSDIENILNVKLFDRQQRGLKILPPAEIFYVGAVALNAICERNIRRGDLLFRRRVKSVKLGCIPPLETSSHLCSLIGKICETWPSIDPNGQIRITTASTNSLLQQVKNHDLHAAIVDNPKVTEDFATRTLASYPLQLAGADIHDETGSGKLSMEAIKALLQKRTFVLPSLDTGLRTLIDDWLHSHNLDPYNMVEVDSITILASMTRMDNFISLLPSLDGLDHLSDGHLFDIPDAPILVQKLVWNEEASLSRPITILHNILNKA